MFKTFKILTTILTIILVSACAVTPNNYIDQEARLHIDNVDAYLAVTQDEIYADIVRSNTTAAAGGGLLFALIDTGIDNSRTKNAEKLITPIRDSLLDYDYAQLLQTDIQAALAKIEWMSIKDVSLERTVGDGHILKKVEESKSSAVFFMTADYKLTPNFDGVTTSISAIMFPNKKALYAFKEKLDENENPIDQSDNIYRNNLVVTVPLGLTDSQKENALTLAKPGNNLVANALNDSSKQIAQRILEDIQLGEVQK